MEENYYLKVIITVMTILSCIGAVVSGYYAFISGRLSKGGIAYQFFIRYSDEKMRQALINLGHFNRETRKIHGDELFNVWHNALINKEQWAIDLEESRHIVKYFYRDVATLYQTKCMRYYIVKKVCSAGGVFLFTDCIIPMDKMTNPYWREDEFYPVQKIAQEMRATLKNKAS